MHLDGKFPYHGYFPYMEKIWHVCRAEKEEEVPLALSLLHFMSLVLEFCLSTSYSFSALQTFQIFSISEKYP